MTQPHLRPLAATPRPLGRPYQAIATAVAGVTRAPVADRATRTPGAVPAGLRAPTTLPGGVHVQPGVPVQSNAGQVPGAGFDGRIASQTVAALRRAGGTSAVYLSAANGNREVAVHAPPGFDPNKPYQPLTYNRGIEGDNANSLEGQHLAQVLRELNAGGRNVLLVLPKSPGVMRTCMPAWPHPGHNGVPSYMLTSFLAARPTRGFSVVR